jgi:probable HAF family extracellular repeat protein
MVGTHVRRRGAARLAATAIVALAAAGAVPVGAAAAEGGAGLSATSGGGGRRITATVPLDPDGRPLLGAFAVNDRGEVAAVMAPGDPSGYTGRAAVWRRGRVERSGPADVSARPRAISERGLVVGTMSGPVPSAPFSWTRRGDWQQLVSGLYAEATDVNDRGQVLGYTWVDEGGGTGVPRTGVWHDGDLTTAPDIVMADGSPLAINDRGQVVVYLTTGNGGVWQVGGGVTELPGLGGDWSIGADINDAGHVAGVALDPAGQRRGTLWRGGDDLIDIGPVETVVAINEHDDVLGSRYLPDGSHQAFLWRDGVTTDLGTLGGLTSTPSDLNDAGQVVGWSTRPDWENRAFVWQDGVMTDLGALAAPRTGATSSVAYDINERGEIAGLARGAEPRAVVWTARR